MQDEDLLDDMALESSDGVGWYVLAYPEQSTDSAGEPIRDVPNTIIFIAVGKSRRPQRDTVLYFTHDGKIRIETNNMVYNTRDRSPQGKQTYPNPKDFAINSWSSPDNPDSYPYGGDQKPGDQKLGFSLRHELTHHELVGKRLINNQPVDASEYNTDIKAMETIRQAWEKWEKSGFTDNSGYYFAFSLPEGGYILTENKSSPDTTSVSSKL